ncbi:hypothetical protein NEUTE1DRAFT_113989 [Neurospora tetrasperma FGSC 2508]|uniref:Uncharacterized protein n=1 Tax=Neurospora tetrasperma (strain FGSC 2508 / ATCC MYA-4615 / P0657) TaxID=510951 RepID=F8MYW7_NEUT8|nr:uncharacterized protein NEUTE1DRAFT_113989 [Neurospora tetrasperma FGSC 2508]EGO51965.1 hypothetical protein NEUTE1DRAFT_113989 [Neurospora tetrasperma FGSC 2508]
MAITYISPRKLKKYYIDPSCDAKFDQQFDGFVQEAMEYARQAVNRLTSSSDLDFARVYETLFKMPKSDKQRFNWAKDFRLMNPHSASVRMTAYEHVVGVLRDFATNWRRTPNHWEADVRFHCDAQTRFIPIHHSSSSSLSSSSSHLTYLDPTNSVFNTGSFPSNLTRQAFTSHELSTEGAKGQVHNLFGLTGIQGHSNVQNPARVVIDLGQKTWEAFSDSIRSIREKKSSSRYQDNASVSDLTCMLLKYKSKVDDVSQWSSVPKIIFHEMMHCRYYGLHDANANANASATCTCTVGSNWQSCMDVVRWGSGPSCVVLNAESYAMLGLMAWLADVRPDDEETSGYTLSREDEGERVMGVVRFYSDITA